MAPSVARLPGILASVAGTERVKVDKAASRVNSLEGGFCRHVLQNGRFQCCLL